jgi:hypothetical protein
MPITETKKSYLLRIEAKRIGTLARHKAPEAWKAEKKDLELDHFLSTPMDALSPATLADGLALSRHLFDQHGVMPSLDYAESVQRLSHTCHLALPRIHGAFITDAMVASYLLEARSDAQYAYNTHIMPFQMLINKPGFVPGPVFVNGYITEGISNYHYIPKQYLWQIDDETLKKAVIAEPERIVTLLDKDLNRTDVLVDMVKDGYNYPYLPLALQPPKGSSTPVTRCLDYLAANGNKPLRFIEYYCCIGMIRRQSLAEVVEMALTAEQTRALSHVYTGEELMPYVKIQPMLKGPLLDEFLGL